MLRRGNLVEEFLIACLPANDGDNRGESRIKRAHPIHHSQVVGLPHLSSTASGLSPVQWARPATPETSAGAPGGRRKDRLPNSPSDRAATGGWLPFSLCRQASQPRWQAIQLLDS